VTIERRARARVKFSRGKQTLAMIVRGGGSRQSQKPGLIEAVLRETG